MAAEMLIAIHADQRQSLHRRADGGTTVWDIKALIGREWRVPMDQQIIVYDGRLVLTNEWATLQEILNGVQPNDELNFTLLFKMGLPTMVEVPLYVISSDNSLIRATIVEVDSGATVLQLKVKINQMEGVPPVRQRLLAGSYVGYNRIDVPMSDDNALWTDFVFVGASIYLYTDEQGRNTIPIRVVEVGRFGVLGIQQIFDMEVEVDTVDTLGGKILTSGQYMRLPFSFYLFSEHSQSYETLDGNNTLSSYNLNSDSTVYLFYRQD